MRFKACLPLLFLLFVSQISGQSRDRIYLHTDRSGYVAGETIWFKAYLFSGLAPGSLATNLYIDIMDETGKTVAAQRVPVFGGVSFGNIDLPLASAQGIYSLRAYTKTQPASDVFSLAAKPLFVFNPVSPDNGTKPREHTCSFWPSSGWLVAGVENTVFLSAADQLGHSNTTAVEIVGSNGRSISQLSTDERGRAYFTMVPVAGEKYTAKLRFSDGTTRDFPLPVPEEAKLVLNTIDAPGAKVYHVLIPPALRNGAALTIRGYMDGNAIFEKQFTASSDHIAARIPTTELPTGILQLKVSNAQQQELASLVTWVVTDSLVLPVQVKADTLNFSARGNNVFTMVLPDSIIGSFSVAVTDPDRTFYGRENNIVSGLMINQDSRNQNFVDPVDPNNPEQLKRALGTSSWTDQARYAGVENIQFDSAYITIAGKLINKKSKKPVSKGDLSFMYTTKDSVTSFMSATLDENGGFVLDNVMVEGKQQFSYSLNGNRWTDLDIVFDTSRDQFSAPFQGVPVMDRTAFVNFAATKSVTETSTVLRADSISSTGLREVIVNSRKTTPAQKVNDKYTRGLFNGMSGVNMLDMVNQPALGGEMILDYLQGKISGLAIRSSGGEYVVQSTRTVSITLMPPVKFFLDEVEVTVDYLAGLRAADVALVKYYQPGWATLPGVGIAPVLSIYRKKPGDGGRSSFASMGNFTYEGYGEQKDFVTDFIQAKEAVAARRNTVYWSPLIMPEESRSVYKIRFTNSDLARKFHVIIEGFAIDGRLVHYEKTFE